MLASSRAAIQTTVNHVEENGCIFQSISPSRFLYWEFHYHHIDNTLVLLMTGTVRHDKSYLSLNSITAGFRRTDGTCTQSSGYPTHLVNNFKHWEFRSKFSLFIQSDFDSEAKGLQLPWRVAGT